MTPRQRPLWLFLLLLFLFPAVSTVVKVIQQGWAGLDWWEWLLLPAFPILIWLWARHFSILGCRACDTVGERKPGDKTPNQGPPI